MGRSIYADTVGNNKGDTWVHKFWVAIQPSDVSDYLDTYEPQQLLADLSVDNEAEIKSKVTELKEKFKKTFGLDYGSYEPENSVTKIDEKERNRQKLASRINLGEHLLETIENMKAAGIEQQQLTIEC